jgi:ribosomal protein S4
LQLKLDSLSLFLGIAPNRLMAQEFINFGGLRINGNVITDKNFSLHQGDMLQLDTKVIQEIRVLYKDAH